MHSFKLNNFAALFSVFLVALAAGGCCASLYNQNRAGRQDEAASVHLAVLSVAPWEDYRDALQPTFKLTADDAVALAVPTTLGLEEKIIEAFSARLKIAAPGTTLSDVTTTHLETGKTPTVKEDKTSTETSGDASKISFADSPATGRSAAGLPPSTSVLGTAQSVDPMLKYLAATALFQEVQMLNRYVKNAAIDERYTPYIVRLQVSLMPRMRDEPYDAYSTISFFSGPFEPDTGGGAPLMIESQFAFDGVKSTPSPKKEQPETAEIKSHSSNLGVKIVPLLVTDDVEAALHSRSLDELRQLALALSAVIHGVGVGADIQSVNEQLRTVLGRDFNSAFTVARVSDNTLRCRFGALNQAQSRFAMIPQTHNVTLLVLVPHDNAKANEVANRTVRLAAKTTLTDVNDGKDLPGRTRDESIRAVEKILADHGISESLQNDDASQILYTVADNDYDSFVSVLSKIVNRKPCVSSVKGKCKQTVEPAKPPYPESVWVDVVSIRNGSQYSSASFSVPQKNEVKFRDSPFKSQTPVLMDDGKTACSVKLRGGVGFESDKLAATLTVSDKVTLPHSDIKVSNGGKEIEIVFPSLAAYKLNNDGKLEVKDVKLHLYELATGSSLATVNCLYVAAADPVKPQFAMSARSGVIKADKDSKGKISLVFSGKVEKPGIFFTVKGADVETEAASGTPAVTQKDDGWSVGGYGTVSMNLSNLDPISPVTISAKDTSNSASLPGIVLPVVKEAAAKQ